MQVLSFRKGEQYFRYRLRGVYVLFSVGRKGAKMSFERKYSEQFRDKRNRDRFQIEFNEEERELFTEMQKALQQSKDATALKQWAYYGYFAFSNPAKANKYLLEKFFINKKNNQRLGLNVEDEIRNKFQTKK